MSESTVTTVQAHFEAAIALARVLERVERSSAQVDADQYQLLVGRLKAALSQDLPEHALNAVLGAHPAAGEVYENMHYQFSGLSRSSLERSASSEVLTAKLLTKVSQGPKKA